MIRIIPVIRILGGLTLGVAALMIFPLLLDVFDGNGASSPFIRGMVVNAFAGATLTVIAAGRDAGDLTRRQAFLTTASAWLLAPLLTGLPFMGVGLTFVEAYFESASGLTTTGATVFTNLEETPDAILLWRAMLNFVGGIGIVVIAILVMPVLRVGGMQIFRTESSDQSDKVFSKGLDFVLWITGVYIALNVICAAVYAALGMSGFDAVTHAFATIATGGFSTHDSSFAWFDSPAIEWAAVVFMCAGALPFVAFVRSIRERNPGVVLRDIQVRAFVGFVFLAALLMTPSAMRALDIPFDHAFRLVAFNAMSIITTTGFASGDFQVWGHFAIGFFFVLMFIGGCSGSTAGGIKVYRLQILLKLATAHLNRLVSPSRTVVVTYSTRRIGDEIEIAILTFLVAYLISTAVVTLGLTALGLDFVTALSGAASALGNVGPGLGDIIGPAGTYAPLPDGAKGLLALAMILGRLEFFTLLVLLMPSFWRG
ncbi:MAG: TrkH family potassium uptake protein [Parvularculaceae bacterium]